MGKQITVVGVGAIGGTIALRLDNEPNVEKIICADYNLEAAERLAKTMKKAEATKVDARNINEILTVIEGSDLLVNGLPPDYNMNLMQAALKSGISYQDMASGPVQDTDFVTAVKRQLALDDLFKEIGCTALINTGTSPGMVNIVARNSAEKMDACQRISVCIYDGVWTRKFIPFWWSPETAFGDMAARPINYENGDYKRVQPFNNPEMIDFKDLGLRRVVDHEHEEPVTFPIFFGGLEFATFKYGGPACELAESLYKMGLLSHEPVDVNGSEVVPFDLVCRLTPPAPSSPEAIREALADGMEMEEGTSLIRVEGIRDGQAVRIDTYIESPGLIESFEKHGISHESFLTGQLAFLFTKLFVNNLVPEHGVYPPEQLKQAARNTYITEADELGITLKTVETLLR